MSKPLRCLLVISLFILFSIAASAVTYVNHDNPLIKVYFEENATITKSELDGQAVIFSPEGFSEEFSYQSDLTVEGSHYLNLTAESKEGKTFRNASFAYVFYLDKTSPSLVSSYPEDGATIVMEDTTLLNFLLNLSEPLDFATFNHTFKLVGTSTNVDVNFAHSDYNIIQGTATINESGEYSLDFSIKDFAGNSLTKAIAFKIIQYLDIEIIKPNNGYSNTTEFDVLFKTNLEADCKFYLDIYNNKDIDTLSEEYFTQFNVTGSIFHSQSGFEIQDNNDIPLFVICKAKEHDFEKKKSFTLYVDTSPPVITVQSSDIANMPLLSKIFISVDEDSLCGYSQENVEFDDMQLIDDEYDTNFEIREPVEDKTDYKYYVACKNKAGLTTKTYTEFIVDTELDLELSIVGPSQKYYAKKSHKINATTNRDAICSYSINDSSSISKKTGSFGIAGIIHGSNTETLRSGSSMIYVKCVASTTTGSVSIIESKEVVIDLTKPIIENVSVVADDDVIWDNTRIEVEVGATDEESGIIQYAYMINSTDINYSTGWILESKAEVYINEDSDGKNLNLTDLKEYFLVAKAKNNADLWSEVFKSDCFFVNTSKKLGICNNSLFDFGDETDVDCGGSCSPCAEGKSCILDKDCQTDYCENGVCKKPSCYDGNKNSDETDVDCGGSTCSKCSDGQKCIVDGDCTGDYCKNNVCSARDPCKNGKKDSGETDIDCGGVCSNKCADYKECKKDSDCINGNCKNYVCTRKSVDSDGDGLPDSWESEHGFDPNDPSDALLDSDGDGLTNLDEFKYGTDPTKADTDGDKYNDYAEAVRYKTDPLNPDSKPASRIGIILFVLFLVVLFAVLVFIVYNKIVLDKKIKVKQSRQIPRFVRRPITPIRREPTPEQIRQMRVREMQQRKIEEEKKRRDNAFSTFGAEKKKETKEKIATAKKGGTTIKKLVKKKIPEKEAKPDTFVKLSKFGKKTAMKKEDKSDAFTKLSKFIRKQKKENK